MKIKTKINNKHNIFKHNTYSYIYNFDTKCFHKINTITINTWYVNRIASPKDYNYIEWNPEDAAMFKILLINRINHESKANIKRLFTIIYASQDITNPAYAYSIYESFTYVPFILTFGTDRIINIFLKTTHIFSSNNTSIWCKNFKNMIQDYTNLNLKTQFKVFKQFQITNIMFEESDIIIDSLLESPTYYKIIKKTDNKHKKQNNCCICC